MANRNRLSPQTLLIIFISAYGLLNILQAYLTPINSDEAYYWMYSRYPAWGYFDHPPAIAIMIKAGYAFLKSELGVRFFVIIAQLITFYLLWQLAEDDRKNSKSGVIFFFLLLFSSPVITISGLFATPDSPLLFFEAVFLYLYKRFREKDDWITALSLGVTMAAIMYSKYHGAVLIIAVILSDLRILKNPKAYAALLLSLILFLPHIFWQHSNNFPSLNYHLVDRASGLTFKEFPQYLLNTLLIHNPLILPAGLFIIFTRKNKTGFERTLLFIIAFVLVFFLFASFRYHVEPHWTALIAMPMIILIFNNADLNRGIYRYIRKALYVSFGLILFARITIMFDILPVEFIKKNYHESKRWFMEIKKIAGDKPVVFTNSYQNASKYTFYTGGFSHSLNNLNYRKNQFDLWNFEEKLHGKKILYVPHFLGGDYKEKLDRYIASYGDTIYAREFSGFQSLQKECCIIEGDKFTFLKVDTCEMDIALFNPYPFPVDLKNNTFPVRFEVCFFQKGVLMYNEYFDIPTYMKYLNTGDTIRFTARFTIDDVPEGKYKIAVCSETGIEYMTYNSKFKDAIVIQKDAGQNR